MPLLLCASPLTLCHLHHTTPRKHFLIFRFLHLLFFTKLIELFTLPVKCMTFNSCYDYSLCIMRVMPIRVYSDKGGFTQMKDSFKKNWIHYFQEALGLAIFMISACFFSALFWGNNDSFHYTFQNEELRNIVNGVLMGLTALFIFYSPFTAPSGSQINPSVTITFLRLNKMCPFDALFYILFQFVGGTLAVYIMAALIGDALITPPVIIAVIMMTMVLFTSEHTTLKKYTRIFSGCFVCIYVIIGGPISGFGMNPARSLASAFPAHTYTAC